MNYSDFVIKEKQLKDYNQTLADKALLEVKLKELEELNVKLNHENFGLKQKIKNLEEKLYKRNESFKGNVWDKDLKKGWKNL